MKLKTAISQIKPVTGDIDGNTHQIITDIRKAINEGVDIIVFPELAITGYCCGALFAQKHFIQYNLDFLYKKILPEVTGDLICVIGHASFHKIDEDNPFDKGVENQDFALYNSCSVIQSGEILKKYNKVFLANDGHHEDRKYFTPGIHSDNLDENPIGLSIKVKGQYIRLNTLICEDIWQNPEVYDYAFDSVHTQGFPSVTIALNHSYFYYGKTKERLKICEKIANTFGHSVIYCNPVGVGDIVKNIMIYDGNSFAIDGFGQLVYQAPAFKEELGIFNLDIKNANETIKENHPSKYEEIFDALVFTQKEFFRVCGLKRAQVHISGGLDSAVAAVISVKAMGAENCFFISNPTSFNGEETRRAAQSISQFLRVKLWWNPTGEIVNLIERVHEKSFNDKPNQTGLASIHAVSRTVQGLAASHFFSSGIVAAGNHTEIVLGWASFHDIGSIGVMSIIGDLTKVEVFELAKYINERLELEVIPSELYDGRMKPAAELPDANEDPFDYFVVSGICAEIIRNKKGIKELTEAFNTKTLTEEFFPLDWDNKTVYEKLTLEQFKKQLEGCFHLARVSVYKAAQSAPVPLISRFSRGFSSRETLINHYKGDYKL